MKPKQILDKEATFEELGVENCPVISKSDLQGNIIFANKAFTKLTGYSREEIKGQPHNILRHPDMPKSVFKKMWNQLEKGERFRGIIKNLRKDGRYYWVEIFVEPCIDENGTKTGYICATRPVSEDDKEKFNKLYKKLKEEEENSL